MTPQRITPENPQPSEAKPTPSDTPTPWTDAIAFCAHQKGFDGELECVLAADSRQLERTITELVAVAEEVSFLHPLSGGIGDKARAALARAKGGAK